MEINFDDRYGHSVLPHLLNKARENAEKELKDGRKKAKKELDEANEKALTDSLTGLFNRRFLDEELPKMIERLGHPGGQRETDPDYILLFVLDLNKFKNLNDGHGHHKGDEALIGVARRLKKDADERMGRAVRFGGDEFALVQEGKGNITDERIQEIAERIKGKLNFSLPTQDNRERFDITVSMGWSVLRKGEVILLGDESTTQKTPEEAAKFLINEADKRMYVDKKGSIKPIYESV